MKMLTVPPRGERSLRPLLLLLVLSLVLGRGAPGYAETVPPPSDYDELDLADLLDTVVTASPRPQTVAEAPSNMVVLQHDELMARGVRSVGEALRAVPGIALINDHTYWHVGVRGLFGDASSPSDTIKVMINGQQTAFRSNAANLLGVELIPIEAVKRIEVLLGPGSVLYGANALLGVVNIITYDGAPREDDDCCGGQSTGHAGDGEAAGGAHRQTGLQDAVIYEGGYSATEHTRNFHGGGSFTSGRSWERFRYFVAGRFRYEDRSGLVIPGIPDMLAGTFHDLGPDHYEADKGYPTPGWDPASRQALMVASPSRGDEDKSGSVYGVATLALGKLSELSLDLSAQLFNKYGEYQPDSAMTHANRISYANGFVRLRYKREPEENSERGLLLNASVALAGGRPYDDHLVDPLVRGSYKTRSFGYLAVDTMAEAGYAFSKDSVIMAGGYVSIDMEDLVTMEVVHEETGNRYSEPGYGSKTFRTYGFYGHGSHSPFSWLGLTVGGRMDHNNVIGCDKGNIFCFGSRRGSADSASASAGAWQLSTRAAAVFRLGVAGTYAKLLYGTSYRPPSPFQLYHRQATIIGSEGNPRLLPQTAQTVEALVGTRPVAGLHLSANYYLTTVDDLVFHYLEGSSLQSRNADALVHGFELGVSYAAPPRIEAFANSSVIVGGTIHPQRLESETDYVWERSIFNDDIPLTRVATVMVNGGLILSVPEGFMRIGLSAHWVGSRRASLINNLLYNNTSLGKSYDIPGYLLTSATVTSTELRWLGMATVVSANLRMFPGAQVEPGTGGVDIPSTGPQLFLRVEQRF